MEIEDVPLQLSLLTMELALQRQALERIATLFETIGAAIRPPGLGNEP